MAALLVPASAAAAHKTSTLPDPAALAMTAYDLTVGWLIGTVQDATFTDARVVQTSDTTSAVRGTFQREAYEPTNAVALEAPLVFPNGIQLTHVHLNPLHYDVTAADAKDRRAICSAEERLTDPKKPPVSEGWANLPATTRPPQRLQPEAAGPGLDGGVIGTLDIYAGAPREWDPSEVAALRA